MIKVPVLNQQAGQSVYLYQRTLMPGRMRPPSRREAVTGSMNDYLMRLRRISSPAPLKG